MAGNQLGKTFAGGMEMAFHLSGIYPVGWIGRTWDRPVRAWSAGISNEQTRDVVQKMLFGSVNAIGTGTIPGSRIRDIVYARGISDFIDYALIEHEEGGSSYLKFKSYEQKRAKWQGDTVDIVWCDEEAPLTLYGEAVARITATNGMIYTTFTPLLGMTEVVEQFYPEPTNTSRGFVQMGIEDAHHIPADRRDEIIAGYPPHEREARANGTPVLGSGAVYPIALEDIVEEPIRIPDHWARICGMDFGWDHPTTAAWLAWDRDTDTVHLYDCYSRTEEVPAVHASAIKSRGDLPVAWPHDGYKHDSSGSSLRDLYAGYGIRMIPENAKYESGDWGVEAGIMDILDRMRTGRFKVSTNCQAWFEEFRTYHRKDGQIVKRKDDLMDATRYAVMSLRFARPKRDPMANIPLSVGGDYDPFARTAEAY